MQQLRETIQEMNGYLVNINKAFEKKDHESNQDNYEKFKDCVAIIQLLGCRVIVHETWESEFVVCEVEIEGVKY